MRAAELPRWRPSEYRQRPRDFDPGLGEQICERVANGETLSEICFELAMPMPATFLAWTRQDPELGKLWHQAQLDRLDIFSEECVALSGQTDPALVRNQMTARQWSAERLNPKKYSPRSTLKLGQGDDDGEAGVDYGAEVRRKLDEMAKRQQAAREEAARAAETADTA